MKRLVIFELILLFLFSCQKSELEFSCDPNINKFIIDNREKLSTMTIQELGSYDLQVQKAIFTSWDYRKKRSAWVDKLMYIKVNIPFNEIERSHIQILIDHINEDYFLKENLDRISEFRFQFASQWISYAINNLGWSNQFIAFMAYRLYTDQSQLESELSSLKSISTTNSTNSEGDCNCNVSYDFCGDTNCQSGGCSITSGCGWLWTMPCDGRCY